MRRFREAVAEDFGIPKDVLLDLPRVSLCGDKEIYIENHKGIMEYTRDCVRVKMKDGIISVRGVDMRIIIMQRDRLVVNGDFEGVEYEKIGRKRKNVQKNL